MTLQVRKPLNPVFNPSHPLSRELFAAYLFNDRGGLTLREATQGRHNGTLNSMASTAWKQDFLEFRGVDATDEEQVEIPYSAEFAFGDGTTDRAVTLCIGVRNHATTGFSIFNSNGENGSPALHQMHWLIDSPASGGEVRGNFYDTNGSNRLTFSTTNDIATGDLGEWHDYAVTYDGSGSHTGIQIYRDGVALAMTNSETGTYVAMDDVSTSFYIGSLWDQGSPGYFANMDVAYNYLYWRDLSQNELAAMSRDPYQMFRSTRSIRRLVKAPAVAGLSIPVAMNTYRQRHQISVG